MNNSINVLKSVLLFIAVICFSANVTAGNRTISGLFDGTEATMAVAPESCDGQPKAFSQAGTVTVSTSGTYRIVDGGNDFGGISSGTGIGDVVVMLYEESFNSNAPTSNRVAFVDIGANVTMNTGTNYVVVVQFWCEPTVGPYAAVISGPGDINGAGFNSLAHTLGEITQASESATFTFPGGQPEVWQYDASDPVVINRPGQYYWADIGPPLDHGFINVWVYENEFDPTDTQKNLAQIVPLAPTGQISLDAGTYVFVAVDFAGFVSKYQFLLFPPGNMIFNPGLTAAWGTPGVGASGILLEVFPDTEILFFAWFTFADKPIVQSASLENDSGSKSGLETHLGSDDQRWLTGFGFVPGDGSNFMNVAYENSTGGAFNVPNPEGMIDSSYGSGWIELFNCSRFNLNYSLPGGLEKTVEMVRLVHDGVEYCRSFIKPTAISPPF